MDGPWVVYFQNCVRWLGLHPRWLPWADIVLTYIVEPYGIWIVKVRCIRHADILKRAYLCQVSDTGSPEPLVFVKSLIEPHCGQEMDTGNIISLYMSAFIINIGCLSCVLTKNHCKYLVWVDKFQHIFKIKLYKPL